jgi:transposase
MKGYSIKGTPLSIQKLQPRMTTVSSLVIISNNEIIKHKEIQGSYNKESFLSFLSDLNLPKKSVILLDNVKFHHCYDIKEFAKHKQWDLLYTPPYSPWFNPIEGVFSIIKRTFYSTFDINMSFKAVTKEHCSSFFKKSLSI